jgi:spore coat protein A
MTNDSRLHHVLLNGLRFDDPITEDPRNGTIEIWEIVNPTIDAHPIHLHAIHFQLLDRRRFDVRRHERTSEVVFIREAIPAAPEEQGWKDTILCPPGQVTRIIAPFSGSPGKFVWHCHMLEHEDNEMMRPYLLRG